MTEKAHSYITVRERHVTQLVRSPGPYFEFDNDSRITSFILRLLFNRGAWLEYETDSAGVLYVRVDKNQSCLSHRSKSEMGLGSNEEISIHSEGPGFKDI